MMEPVELVLLDLMVLVDGMAGIDVDLVLVRPLGMPRTRDLGGQHWGLQSESLGQANVVR